MSDFSRMSRMGGDDHNGRDTGTDTSTAAHQAAPSATSSSVSGATTLPSNAASSSSSAAASSDTPPRGSSVLRARSPLLSNLTSADDQLTEEESKGEAPEEVTRRELRSAKTMRDDVESCNKVFSLRFWVHYGRLWGFLDWLCVIGLAALLGGVNSLPNRHVILTPQQLADPSINQPYLSQTVPNALLAVLAVILPIACIWIIFATRFKQAGSGTELRIAMLAFAVAILTTLIATTFGKRYISRPRPNYVQYVQYHNGTIGAIENQQDAFSSFPSGHSSMSFAGLGFLAMYMYYNVYCYWRIGTVDAGGMFSSLDGILVRSELVFHRRRARERTYAVHNNQLPLLLLCSAPLWLAAWIAMTRVKDYWHNYDDILAGSVIGIFIAYACYTCIYQSRCQEWLALNHAAFADAVRMARDRSVLRDISVHTDAIDKINVADHTAGIERVLAEPDQRHLHPLEHAADRDLELGMPDGHGSAVPFITADTSIPMPTQLRQYQKG